VGLPVIAVSTDEVVWALLRTGFEIRDRSGGLILLDDGWRLVEVPVVTSLVPPELLGVLRQAGISYCDFIEHLADAPTEPDVEARSGERLRRVSAPVPRRARRRR
jgi:hypothetical protein